MNEISVDQLLVQMRSMAEKTQGLQVNTNQTEGMADFSTMLKSSVDKVNEVQQQAGQLKTAFELGDKDTNLADVMIGVQKANLSFQAMTQVRNRLVSAYQDVMNMQL
jgi:flagellar hook-basal body complex protein FliE